MQRSDVLQAILDRFAFPRYLEVGTFQGVTFHALRAATKVAVDPQFRFQVPVQPEPGTAYHQVTSDRYFAEIAPSAALFDVIYLDGLHTFEQTLRDLLNAICHLAPRGVIVVDDVIPSTFYAALPNYADFDQIWRLTGQGDGSWMGDVYRLVFFVESFLQAFSYATVAENHGQLVLWRETRSDTDLADRTVRQVGELAYTDVLLQRERFRITPLSEILSRLPRP